MTNTPRIFIGHSENEARATDVAESSLLFHARRPQDLVVERISRQSLGDLYTRPTETRDGQLWDVISQAPMSTDHALARFWVPYLCGYQGWALFVDGDTMLRRPIEELFALADDRYAVMCVQHPELSNVGLKKVDQHQVPYTRKNWSSCMLIQCGYYGNSLLTLATLNATLGRFLHGFGWLADHEIGALPSEWNYLVGVNPPMVDPAIVHWTLGTPDQRTYNEKYVAPSLVQEWWSYAPQQVAHLG